MIPVGGWPLFVPEGYRNFFNNNGDRFKSGKLVAVAADTLPSELQLLKEGYVARSWDSIPSSWARSR